MALLEPQRLTRPSAVVTPASRRAALGPVAQLSSPAPAVLEMRQAFGNQAMQRLLRSGAVQAKLTVNEPGDQCEQEADRVAEQVMRMREPQVLERAAIPGSSSPTPIQRVCRECEEELSGRPVAIQRMCLECEEELHRQPMEEEQEEETIQTKVISGRTPEVAPDLQAQINGLRSVGQTLPESLRTFFEPRFGYDFSEVRVHTDAASRETAQALNARAFTAGRDIFFNDQEFQPATHTGRRLLAHELAHTVQQAASRFPDGQPIVQRTIGDGHDLANPRFSGEPRLEAAFDNERVIAVGSCGDHVRIIQEALLDLGFDLPKFGADCEFGSETQRAVVRFQAENRAVTDGAVGFQTMALLDTLAPPGPPPAIECTRCPPPVKPEEFCVSVGRCDPSKAGQCGVDPNTKERIKCIPVPGERCGLCEDLPAPPGPRCKCFLGLAPEATGCGSHPFTGKAIECIPKPGEPEGCGVCNKPGRKQVECMQQALEEFKKDEKKCDDEEKDAALECLLKIAECGILCIVPESPACLKCVGQELGCFTGEPARKRIRCGVKAIRKRDRAIEECEKIPD